VYHISTFGGVNMNVEFEQKRCKNLSLIELEEVTANFTGQKNVIFILKFKVNKLNVDSIIGNPVPSKKFLFLKTFSFRRKHRTNRTTKRNQNHQTFDSNRFQVKSNQKRRN
jgi:hypothetical protein